MGLYKLAIRNEPPVWTPKHNNTIMKEGIQSGSYTEGAGAKEDIYQQLRWDL